MSDKLHGYFSKSCGEVFYEGVFAGTDGMCSLERLAFSGYYASPKRICYALVNLLKELNLDAFNEAFSKDILFKNASSVSILKEYDPEHCCSLSTWVDSCVFGSLIAKLLTLRYTETELEAIEGRSAEMLLSAHVSSIKMPPPLSEQGGYVYGLPDLIRSLKSGLEKDIHSYEEKFLSDMVDGLKAYTFDKGVPVEVSASDVANLNISQSCVWALVSGLVGVEGVAGQSLRINKLLPVTYLGNICLCLMSEIYGRVPVSNAMDTLIQKDFQV
jgi:hypothetical protein